MPQLLSSGSPIAINDVDYAVKVEAKLDLKDKTDEWVRVQKQNIENALGAMAMAIVYRARMTVPYKTGALSQSGRVEEDQGLTRTVVFGNAGVPYAAYQERGMRFDGSHVVRNYTTPGTGSRYLQTAAETTVKEGIKKYL